MNIKFILKVIASYVPGFYRWKGTGGTISARYCYSVWLRHLAMLYRSDLSTMPNVIAELGPGDSLGIGLCAMLTGVNKYWALDVVRYTFNKRNLMILNELTELLIKREKIPDEMEFPEVKPLLDSYDFPSHILTEQRLNRALNPKRIEMIKRALLNAEKPEGDIQIRYVTPWHGYNNIPDASIDMIFSQAVLEHIDDLLNTYLILYRWLKPNGIVSHAIDFRCRRTAEDWNGHWTYSDLVWKLIKGNRPYLLNRYPHSIHIQYMQKCGFEIVCDIRYKNESRIQKKDLALKFGYLTDDDLTTSEVFIQAVKKYRNTGSTIRIFDMVDTKILS